jgi:hypothetical protein
MGRAAAARGARLVGRMRVLEQEEDGVEAFAIRPSFPLILCLQEHLERRVGGEVRGRWASMSSHHQSTEQTNSDHAAPSSMSPGLGGTSAASRRPSPLRSHPAGLPRHHHHRRQGAHLASRSVQAGLPRRALPHSEAKDDQGGHLWPSLPHHHDFTLQFPHMSFSLVHSIISHRFND